MLLFLLFACAASHREASAQFTGSIEPRWWYQPGGYGESPNDEIFAALTLRLDQPYDGVEYVLYSAGELDTLQPDAGAATCIGGHVKVEGNFVPLRWLSARGAITHARVLSCTPPVPMAPPYGETVTLSGTLRRWWWYLAPGYGAEPSTDAVADGSVLVVDGRVVPLFGATDERSSEQRRRFYAACDGQEVTVTGTWKPANSPKVTPPYKLVGVTFAGPCAEPALHRSPLLPDKPMPKEWLE